MSDQPIRTQTSRMTPTQFVGSSSSHLREEYDRWRTLFNAEPVIVQRFLEGQARALADALIQRQSQLRFTLPETVVLEAGGQLARVPDEFREQMAGGLIDRLTRAEGDLALRQRLSELEQSPNRAIATSAGLIRFATAMHMVHN